jgi:hypothetical protein
MCRSLDFNGISKYEMEVAVGVCQTVSVDKKENSSLLWQLRKECWDNGIEVKMVIQPWGPELVFSVDSVYLNSMPRGIYCRHASSIEALAHIKRKYEGLSFQGEKVYGL